MNYTDIRESIISQFSSTNSVAYLLIGPPGGGKTDLCRDIGRALDFDKVVSFNASLRDPVDLMGTPRNNGAVTEWIPPKELHQLTTGRNLLIMEEVTDASMSMQNPLCGLIYDRRVNDMVLSDETYIIMNGNRTEDKSGAQRLSTKLANRVRIKEFDVDLEAWCTWAIDANIDLPLIQFLRFRPALLSAFDPNQRCNPTPRSWARASRIDASLRSDLFFGEVAGDVGEAAAAEYTGFRMLYEKMPDLDLIMMNPKTAPVPTDPTVQFAVAGALTYRATKDNIDRVMSYVSRLPEDFSIKFMKEATKLKPDLRSTRTFVTWAVANANVMI